MTSVNINGHMITVNGVQIDIGANVLNAVAIADFVLVLIDPDTYLRDPEYRKKRREGAPAVRNLRAVAPNGQVLWEAEMPDAADYYHRIRSVDPIDVDSFSGYRCRIDPRTGKIVYKEFMK